MPFISGLTNKLDQPNKKKRKLVTSLLNEAHSGQEVVALGDKIVIDSLCGTLTIFTKLRCTEVSSSTSNLLNLFCDDVTRKLEPRSSATCYENSNMIRFSTKTQLGILSYYIATILLSTCPSSVDQNHTGSLHRHHNLDVMIEKVIITLKI